MNYCKDCKHSKKEMMQINPSQAQLVLHCNHEECHDPVEAQLLPCNIVRQATVLCGFVGKYYEARGEVLPPETTSPQNNAGGGSIIQLVK